MYFVLSKASKKKMLGKIVRIAKMYEILKDREKKWGPFLMPYIKLHAGNRIDYDPPPRKPTLLRVG